MAMLTKEQITAMRNADHVGFHHSPNSGRISTVNKNGNTQTILVTSQAHIRYGFPAGDVTLCYYGLNTIGRGKGRQWKSIASFLKAGDIIQLDWYRDGDTEGYLLDTDLHADRLTIIIRRLDKIYEFLIDIVVNKDNANRMIRVRRGTE